MKDKIVSFYSAYKFIIKIVVILIVVAVSITVLLKYYISPNIVVGDSMYPALNADDVVLANCTESAVDNIERYDIVVFPYKYDIKHTFIKRIIGLPGDTVQIKDDIVYVNDERLFEFYGYYDEEMKKKAPDYMFNMDRVELGVDEYFVLGDNRYTSVDSRSDDVGIVKKEEIIGVVRFRLWPFNSIGSLENQ